MEFVGLHDKSRKVIFDLSLSKLSYSCVHALLYSIYVAPRSLEVDNEHVG